MVTLVPIHVLAPCSWMYGSFPGGSGYWLPGTWLYYAGIATVYVICDGTSA